MMWALGHALYAVSNPVGAAQLRRARNEPSSGSYAVVPNERTGSMNCCGPVILATAVAAMIGFGSSALAQALQPAGPTQAPVLEQAPRAPATTPAQPSPPGMSATATPTSPEVRRPSIYRIYRTCVRTARRKGLRGAKRRSFVTRCRLGREPVIR